MAGKIRRDTCPFLWVLLMGLCENVSPGKEELVQVCIL